MPIIPATLEAETERLGFEASWGKKLSRPYYKNKLEVRHQWLTLTILPTQETEIRKISVQSQPQ
jgi:hypothetical protein